MIPASLRKARTISANRSTTYTRTIALITAAITTVEPMSPEVDSTASIVATIAPGPASSGVPNGTIATFTAESGASCSSGLSNLPVSNSNATSSSSRPPETCSAPGEMCR